MPRKNLIRTSEYPYHLIGRANNRDWFDLDPQTAWRVFNRNLYNTSVIYNTRVHNFILMRNHFHLDMSTPEGNVDQAMRYFLTETSRNSNRLSGRVNHVFGGRYKWNIVDSPNYYLNMYKYLLVNPIKAGVCQRVEEYPWSTLYGQLGLGPLYLPIYPSVFDGFLDLDVFDRLPWLNKPVSDEDFMAIGLALRKPTFRLPIDRVTRKPHPLEIDFI